LTIQRPGPAPDEAWTFLENEGFVVNQRVLQLEKVWREIGRRAPKTSSSYPDAGQIKILTIHKSKGREFQKVVLISPDQLFADDDEGRGQLLYVAATRARNSLKRLSKYPGVFKPHCRRCSNKRRHRHVFIPPHRNLLCLDREYSLDPNQLPGLGLGPDKVRETLKLLMGSPPLVISEQSGLPPILEIRTEGSFHPVCTGSRVLQEDLADLTRLHRAGSAPDGIRVSGIHCKQLETVALPDLQGVKDTWGAARLTVIPVLSGIATLNLGN
jgi:hypothetical protein